MRNWEAVDTPDLFMEGHDDVDLLCTDLKQIIMDLGAKREGWLGHYDHYWVKVSGRKIEFGIRYVGDRYYDKKWENEMLKASEKYHEFYNVLNPINYYYSLIYHATFHKRNISEDYLNRINDMGKVLGIVSMEENQLMNVLEKFLSKEKYNIVFPLDVTVPNYKMQMAKNIKAKGYGLWLMRKVIFFPRLKIKNIIKRFI